MAGLEPVLEPLPRASLAWMSPEPGGVSFAMAYMSDGGHIGTLGWPEGSAGWRSIDKVGAEAALAPGLDAIKKMWIQLLPESEKGISGPTSIDQVRYVEPSLLSCKGWWTPGVLLIGDSAHFFGPETGVSSGIGIGAQALAEAVRQFPNDSDAACQNFITCVPPVVRPYRGDGPRAAADAHHRRAPATARGALASGRLAARDRRYGDGPPRVRLPVVSILSTVPGACKPPSDGDHSSSSSSSSSLASST